MRRPKNPLMGEKERNCAGPVGRLFFRKQSFTCSAFGHVRPWATCSPDWSCPGLECLPIRGGCCFMVMTCCGRSFSKTCLDKVQFFIESRKLLKNYFALNDPHHDILSWHPFILFHGLSGILSGIYSDILSATLSCILSGIYFAFFSGILSGICFEFLSGILFGICSDILSGIYSEILLGILLCKCSDILSGILCGILSNISSDIRSGILPNICSHNRSDILSFYLAVFLAFYRVQACPTASGAGDLVFGSMNAPQHPERATWLGPAHPHSLDELAGREGGRGGRRRTRRRGKMRSSIFAKI